MKTIGNKILVTKIEEETTSSTGIIYKDPTKLTLARVIATGDEVKTIEVGDTLIVNWAASVNLKHGDIDCNVLETAGVFAIL